MKITREKAVSRLDRLLRVAVIAVLGVSLLFILFMTGNALHYRYVKRGVQIQALERANIDLLELPPGAEDFRLPVEPQGDPLEQYLRVQLDFRAFEKDYIAAKLRHLPNTSEGRYEFAAIDLLTVAATRPLRIYEITYEQESRLRPHDLRDAATVLLRAAERRATASERPDLEAAQAEDLRGGAERLLRAYYTTGLYLATRPFRLTNVEVGVRMMREGAQKLHEYYERFGREEEALATERLMIDLEPLSERIDEILSYRDDDRHLEVWVKMLRESRSPAARLFAAEMLAQVGRRWWRYGESARAVRELRRAVTASHNYSFRSALYDLIQAVEENGELPISESSVFHSSGSELQRLVDHLF